MTLRAADCVIINYRELLTSGAASLARSFGVPLLIPARLNTVNLGEPVPRVFLFQSPAEFAELLPKAFAAGAPTTPPNQGARAAHGAP